MKYFFPAGRGQSNDLLEHNLDGSIERMDAAAPASLAGLGMGIDNDYIFAAEG
jgi:hypothetical protein